MYAKYIQCEGKGNRQERDDISDTCSSFNCTQSWNCGVVQILCFIDISAEHSLQKVQTLCLLGSNGTGTYGVFNTFCCSDAIWRPRTLSILIHVMVRCLTAPSHYLNQC